MTWLADTAFEESERFVGRSKELQQFQAWLHDAQPLTQLWDVHGIAGMGKSTLLWQWMAYARRQQLPTVWMDGRSCPKQPVQFLDHLFDTTENVLPISSRKKMPWPDRFFWVIDNFDDMESIEPWLREDLIARLPEQGGLLVFASRRGLSAQWHVHPIWAHRVQKMPLSPWTLHEARTYFHRIGLQMTEELQQVLRPLHGHPLSMAVAGEYFSRRGTVMQKRDYSFLETITAELLREVTDPELHPFLDILTVLPSANQDMITAIAEPLVISMQQYRDLSRLSFVRRVPGGLALHDVIRSQLLASMQEHHPMTLKHLRLKALDYLGSLYRQSQSGSEKNHLGYLLLEITAQSLPISSPYANIAAIDEIVRENELKEGDLECLHAMIEHWGRQSLDMPNLEVAHAFLDDIVRNIDGGIRLFRAPSGEVVAFFASLPLYQMTVELIEQYVPGSLAKYFPHDTSFPLDPEHVDTFFGVLVGVKPDDPRYHAHDLLGILIRDGLSHLGRGLRGVIGVSEPNLKQLLELLGFIPHPIDAQKEIDAFTLDMRQRDFLLWVGSIVQTLNRPAIRMQYPIDENLLRRVLKELHDPNAFRKTGIGEILGCQPEEARYILQSLLTKAPIPPLSKNEQNLLRLTFVERIGNADSIALALHLSRPTYYRMLKQSLVNLCTVLQSGDFLSAALE